MKFTSGAIGVFIRNAFREMPDRERQSFLIDMLVRDYMQHQIERNAMSGPHKCPRCLSVLTVSTDGTIKRGKKK